MQEGDARGRCKREMQEGDARERCDNCEGRNCSSYGGFHHSLNHRKVRIHITNRQQCSFQEYSPVLGNNAHVFHEK
jgi:hypothetical protein